MSEKPKNGWSSVLYIAYGLCIGCGISAAFQQNIGLGAALGGAAGAAFMAFALFKKR